MSYTVNYNITLPLPTTPEHKDVSSLLVNNKCLFQRILASNNKVSAFSVFRFQFQMNKNENSKAVTL